jgi:hypothetical protein
MAVSNDDYTNENSKHDTMGSVQPTALKILPKSIGFSLRTEGACYCHVDPSLSSIPDYKLRG